MKIHNDTLILRIELITLGPDQILLGMMIAWIAKFVVKIPTAIFFVLDEEDPENTNVDALNFEGLKLLLESGEDIKESEILHKLKLAEVAHLLSSALRDLTIAECGPERLAFFTDCDEFKKLALKLLNENESEGSFDLSDNEEFRQASADFQKKYSTEIDHRLRPLFIEPGL